MSAPDSTGADQGKRFLDTLAQATRPLSATDDIMAATTRLLGEYLQARQVAFGIMKPDGERFEIRHEWSASGAPVLAGSHVLADFGERILQAMRAGQTVALPDAAPEPQGDGKPAALAGPGPARGAVLWCPLVKDGSLLALLVVSHACGRQWSSTEVALVEEVAERSWYCIERGRSQKELQAAERRNARLAAQLQLALDSAGLGTWRVDLASRTLITDARFRAIFGTDAERLGLEEAARLVHPEDLDRVRRAIGAAIQPDDPQPYDLEYRVMRPDGTARWVRATGRANFIVRNGARLMASFDGTIADVTERRQVQDREREAAAQALAAAEANAKFRAFFDQGSYFAGVMSLDGTLIEANRLCLDACGYTREQTVGRKFWDCGWWNRSAALVDMVREGVRCAAQGQVFRRETSYFIADGSERMVDLILAPVKDDAGRVLYIAPTGVDITERLAVEAELRAARARLDATLAAGEIGTWSWDVEADRVYPDRNLARLFGLTGRQAAGGDPLSSYIDAVHPDDRDCLMAAIRQALESGAPYEARYRVRRPDGSYRHVIARGRADHHAGHAGRPARMPGVVVDITRQQQAEEDLRASEERYRTLIELMDEGFCVLDMIFDAAGEPVDYRLLEINPAFIKLTGLNDPVGKTIRELVPGIEPHWIRRYGEVALTGEPKRSVDMMGMLGRWYDTYAVRVGGADSRRLALIFTDITERKQAEDDLRRLAFNLAEVDQRKTEFLATLAHELRNPLAPIQSGLDLMRLAPGNPQVAERTRAIMERQLGHLVHLVNDLLDLARISRGQVELKKRSVDLNSVLASAIETSMPLIQANRHTLSTSLPDGPLPLRMDPTRIAQVVANLLNNAAKYTPPGGRIELAARRAGSEVVITVTDNGIGLPEAARSVVFEMFSQIRTSRDLAQGGLGIGLSLVRRLVGLHGGSVSASSPGIGQGSSFTVRLPWPGEAADDAMQDQADADARQAAALRILVVDDNGDAAATLAELLALIGHATRVAHDGGQALAAARDFQPDAVFLDLGLPGMDGHEVARRLRGIPGLEAARLVALTGWGAEADRQRSREAGFDGHLTKPVALETLQDVLAGLERRPEAHQRRRHSMVDAAHGRRQAG